MPDRSPSRSLSVLPRRVFLPALVAFLAASCDDPVAPVVVSAEPGSMELISGQTGQINASAVGGDSPAVSFASSNPDVAQVSGNGVVTAGEPGSATITVTAGDAGASATVDVTVQARVVTASPESVELVAGETQQVTASASGGTWPMAYASTNEEVATVSDDGVVTAEGPGTATIVVSVADGPSQPASVSVRVNSSVVTAQPSSMELLAGETQRITASAEGGGDLVFESTNAEVATVDAEGLVTAESAGAATIEVSLADRPSERATVSVRVNRAAEVSIKSITQFATTIPVSPENVSGRIDVTVEILRGRAERLEVLVEDEVWEGCTQDLGVEGDAAAAPDPEGDEPDTAAQAELAEIVCSINTAAFDVEDDIATVRFLNDEYRIRARLLRDGEVLDGARTAALSFRNQDFVIVTAEAPNFALSPIGLGWRGGDVTATAIPVQYGSIGEVVTAVFVAGGVSIREDDDGSDGFRVVFPADQGMGFPTHGLAGFESNDFEVLVVTITDEGEPGPGNVSDQFRLDNRGPDGGDFELFEQALDDTIDPRCCELNWVGPEYQLPIGKTGEQDFGVGLRAEDPVTFHVGDADLTDEELAATPPVTTVAGLDETVDNLAYRAVAVAWDRLGNRTIVPLATNPTNPIEAQFGATFGVDATPPISEFTTASVDDLQIFNIATGVFGDFQTTAEDTARADATASGLSDRGFIASMDRWFPGLLEADRCVLGEHDFETGCEPRGQPTVGGVTTIAVPTDNGYYRLDGAPVDRAGNVGDFLTRTVLVDLEAPTVGIGLPATLTGGQPATFPIDAQDDLNLWQYQLRFEYGGVETLPFTFPQLINDRFPSELVTDVSVDATVTYVRAVETTDGADAPSGAVTDVSSVEAWVHDAGGNLTVGDVAPSAPPAGQGFTGRDVQTFEVLVDPVTLCNGGETCTTTQTTEEILARVAGPSGFTRPFEIVHFYMRDAGGVIRYLGASTTFELSDDGIERRWTFEFDLDATGIPAQDNVPIFAVGVHEAGDALRTQDNDNVTIEGDL